MQLSWNAVFISYVTESMAVGASTEVLISSCHSICHSICPTEAPQFILAHHKALFSQATPTDELRRAIENFDLDKCITSHGDLERYEIEIIRDIGPTILEGVLATVRFDFHTLLQM